MAGLQDSIPDNVDSFNVWETLSSEEVESPREEIVLNLDQVKYKRKEIKKHFLDFQDSFWNTWSAAIMYEIYSRRGIRKQSYQLFQMEKV